MKLMSQNSDLTKNRLVYIIKFRHSEKATKILSIFHFIFDITLQHQIISGTWIKFFGLFSEYLNFNIRQKESVCSLTIRIPALSTSLKNSDAKFLVGGQNLITAKFLKILDVQVILFEIDSAIFFTNFQEFFCQFILVNLCTIAEYHVKLWLI